MLLDFNGIYFAYKETRRRYPPTHNNNSNIIKHNNIIRKKKRLCVVCVRRGNMTRRVFYIITSVPRNIEYYTR